MKKTILRTIARIVNLTITIKNYFDVHQPDKAANLLPSYVVKDTQSFR
jgi:hypothetical protein